MPEASRSAPFPTTHWSLVIAMGDRAVPEARAALAKLCDAYRYPIYALIRCQGHHPDAASDLTQDYFTSLPEKAGDRGRRPIQGPFPGILEDRLLGLCHHVVPSARAHELIVALAGVTVVR